MQSHKIIFLLTLYKFKLKKQRAPLPMLMCNLDARPIENNEIDIFKYGN